MTTPRDAVVLLSGGLDSATTLAVARSRGFRCHTLAVHYGQRHSAELERPGVAACPDDPFEAALIAGLGVGGIAVALATQTLLQRPPRSYEVRVDGKLKPGVTAKDIILNLKIGRAHV